MVPQIIAATYVLPEMQPPALIRQPKHLQECHPESTLLHFMIIREVMHTNPLPILIMEHKHSQRKSQKFSLKDLKKTVQQMQSLAHRIQVENTGTQAIQPPLPNPIAEIMLYNGGIFQAVNGYLTSSHLQRM